MTTCTRGWHHFLRSWQLYRWPSVARLSQTAVTFREWPVVRRPTGSCMPCHQGQRYTQFQSCQNIIGITRSFSAETYQEDTDNINNGENADLRTNPDKEFNDLISRFQEEIKPLTYKDWEDVAGEISRFKRSYRRWPVMVMNVLQHKDAVESLFQYMKAQNKPLSLPFITAYMERLVNFGMEHHPTVLALYDELLRDHEILDCGTALAVISILSQTEKWRDCLHLLEMARLSNPKLNYSYFSYIAAAAGRHGDWELMKKMIEEIIQIWEVPSEAVFTSVSSHSQGATQMMEYLLTQMGHHGWTPTPVTISHIEEWFTSLPGRAWEGQTVDILPRDRGLCSSCGNQLKRKKKMSMEECHRLAEIFYQEAIVGSDVYRKTSPKELQAFLDFIDHEEPFDLVMDGLNMGFLYNPSGRKKNPSMQMTKLVEHFSIERKMRRILVIGRKHMSKWNAKYMDIVNELSTCYLLDSSSLDDLFMVYAALKSGPTCKIVTADELRDHSFLLGPAHSLQFRRWQQSHQLLIRRLDWLPRNTGVKVKLVRTSLFETDVHQHRTGWHIPVGEGQEKITSFKMNQSKWLCLHNTYPSTEKINMKTLFDT